MGVTVAVTMTVLFIHYTADLTTTMTVTTDTVPIKSLIDIYKKGYDVLLPASGAVRTILKNAQPGDPLNEFYVKKIEGNPSSMWTNFSNAFVEQQLRKNPKLALVATMGFFEIPDTIMVDLEPSLTTQIAFGLPKGSEFRAALNYFILKMRESGLLKRLKASTSDSLANTLGTEQGEAAVLGYENLLFPFVCLFCGASSAFTLSMIERLQYNWMKIA